MSSLATRAGSRFPPRTFRALRYRDFRLLWIGQVVSGVGTWMQVLAQSLLVLRLSNGSAFALGIVSLAQALSFFLFAPIGGSVADRVNKRRLLLVTQCLAAATAVLLGLLTSTGLIQVWMVVVIAFCSGAVLSFDQPTRAALIPRLVPSEDLLNAISLQPAVNGAAVVGPALGGIVIGLIGLAGDFYLNALSFAAVFVAVAMLRLPPEEPAPAEGHPGLLTATFAALKTVGQDRVLPWVLAGYALLLFLGPSPAFMLPVFATDILHLGPFELGLLFTATGIGTVVGALGVASLGNVQHKGRLMIGGLLLWTAGLVLFALSRNLGLSFLGLGLYGLAQNGVAASTITLLQTRVPPSMHGRVMSLNTLLIMGVRPLGDFPAGVLMTAIGAPLAVLASALLVGTYALYVLLVRPAVREV